MKNPKLEKFTIDDIDYKNFNFIKDVYDRVNGIMVVMTMGIMFHQWFENWVYPIYVKGMTDAEGQAMKYLFESQIDTHFVNSLGQEDNIESFIKDKNHEGLHRVFGNSYDLLEHIKYKHHLFMIEDKLYVTQRSYELDTPNSIEIIYIK